MNFLKLLAYAILISPIVTTIISFLLVINGSELMVEPATFSWYGGEIYSHSVNIKNMKNRGETMVFDQTCYSACTMYLKVAECVYPDIDFFFHAPRKAPDNPMPEFQWIKKIGVNTLKEHYTPSLSEWFESVWRDTQDDRWAILSGKQLIENHGYRECKDSEA